jgi:DNA-binding NarL/FixJ family response regulator
MTLLEFLSKLDIDPVKDTFTISGINGNVNITTVRDKHTIRYSYSLEVNERKPLPKFNDKEERNVLILDLYLKGYTQIEIANQLNVSQKTVSNVVQQLKEVKNATPF